MYNVHAYTYSPIPEILIDIVSFVFTCTCTCSTLIFVFFTVHVSLLSLVHLSQQKPLDSNERESASSYDPSTASPLPSSSTSTTTCTSLSRYPSPSTRRSRPHRSPTPSALGSMHRSTGLWWRGGTRLSRRASPAHPAQKCRLDCTVYVHAKLEFPLFIRWYRDTCLALHCLIRPTTTELPR